MKIGYYHYYFKEVKKRNAPRICHDIRPMLDAYLNFSNPNWKSGIITKDGEELLLLETNNTEVYMLVATRKQEIIKAIHKHTLSCVEISERLEKDESAGFAAYFSADSRSIGLASTLRGPRTSAFSDFINMLIERLGGSRWRMHLSPIGSAITVDHAKAMAFVSRTSVHVSDGNPLFNRLKELLGTESSDIGSFEVVIRGRKTRNIADVFQKIAAEAEGDGMNRMKIRAKVVVEEALADYFVDEYGKMSDELGTGSEKKIIEEVSKKFGGHHSLSLQIDEILEKIIMKTKLFRTLIVLVNLIFGIIIYKTMFCPLTDSVLYQMSMVSKEVASVLSSYAFTVAGFLATIITFLYTLRDRPYFELYKKRGSFSDFMFVCFLELFMLGTLFIVSLGLLAFGELMRLALTLCILSLLHLALLIFISFNLSRRSVS